MSGPVAPWFLQLLSFNSERLQLKIARRLHGRVPHFPTNKDGWYKLTLRYYAAEDRFIDDADYRRAEISMVDLEHWLKQARGLYAHRDLLAPFFQRPTEGK